MSVSALPGIRVPTSAPNEALIKVLRDLLEKAESGQLQSFIGSGFLADGARVAAWADFHPNVYETLGSLAALQTEFLKRRPEVSA